MMRCYSEFSQLATIEERFDYLSLGSEVGHSTFGYDRWANQNFYRSREWRDVRNAVILRDEGYDLGHPDFPLSGPPQIHHMNPITMDDIELSTENLLDPEFLVCVSKRTHNAIHFGDISLLPRVPVARSAGDTRLW